MIRYLVILLALLALATACRRGGGEVPDPAPSVYYWRTTLRLDSTERDFLRRHHVAKMYYSPASRRPAAATPRT